MNTWSKYGIIYDDNYDDGLMFYISFIIIMLYQDDGRMIMKGSVQ